MFLQESDSIANEHPDIQDKIRLVDSYIGSGGPNGVFDPVDIASSTDVDYETVENILTFLRRSGALKSSREIVCSNSNCEVSTPETAMLLEELDDEEAECMSCGYRLRHGDQIRVVFRLTKRAIESVGQAQLEPTLVADGLFRIIGTGERDRCGDIVFIHGLGAEHDKTWTNDDSYGWVEWIGKDLGNWDTYLVDYPTSKTNLFSEQDGNHSIRSVSQSISQSLSVTLSDNKPIVLICHSMGGLVAKKMLRLGLSVDNSHSPLMNRITGVVFLATPHLGSLLASADDEDTIFGRLFKLSKFARSNQTKELEFADDHLFELNTWFLDYFRGKKSNLEILCFSESLPTKPLNTIIVPKISADPGIGSDLIECIDKDHSSIAKPNSQTDIVYLYVKKFIKQLSEHNYI